MHSQEQIDRLVVRPRPYDGESLSGYLIRVTSANSYPALSYLLGDPDGNTGGFTKKGKEERARQQWRALEARLDLPAGEFIRRWPRHMATTRNLQPVLLGALAIKKADHVPGITQVCPECVAEDGFAQELWEVRYYTVCHRHERVMVTHCGACGCHLSQHRPVLSHCGNCGRDLRETCKPLVPDRRALVMGKMVARAVAGEPMELHLFSFPFCLQNDVRQTIAAIRMMGWLTQPRFSGWMTAAAPAESRQEQLTSVISLFENWPNVWWDSLDSIVAERSCRKGSSIARVLLKHRRMLSKKSRLLGFMQRDFVEWASQRRPDIWKSRSFRELSKAWRHQQMVFTTMEAADWLGCASPAIRKMAEDGRLEIVPDNTGSNRLLVTAESVRRVDETRRPGGFNWKEARARLKCDSRLILDPWFRALMEVKHDHRGQLLISEDRMKWLFAQIESRRREGRPHHDLRAVGMRSVVVRCKPIGGTYASILSWILDGKLPVAGFSQKRGLRSLTFYREDLDGHIRSATRALQQEID